MRISFYPLVKTIHKAVATSHPSIFVKHRAYTFDVPKVEDMQCQMDLTQWKPVGFDHIQTTIINGQPRPIPE